MGVMIHGAGRHVFETGNVKDVKGQVGFWEGKIGKAEKGW